jgi:hypothetical protein
MARANDEFKNIASIHGKSLWSQQNSKEAVEALKNIYFRFRSENEDMNNKFKEYNEKFKSM